MDGNDTQSFLEDKPIQESSDIVQEQIEEISSTLVTITEFADQTWNNQEHLNESVSIENLSITQTLWSKSDSFKHKLLHKFQASIYLIIYIPSTCRVLCFMFPPGRIQGNMLCKIMIFVVSAMKKVVVQKRSAKKIFLKALKNICARVSSYISLQANAWIFIKKENMTQMFFPVNFVKFLRKSFSQNTSGRLLLSWS